MGYLQVKDDLDRLFDREMHVDYCYNDLKLENVRNVLEKLGNPQHSFKAIHIAGTKGKGSTCAFVFSMLKEAGIKCGLYTSPHLINLRERIKISYSAGLGETQQRMITEDEFCAVFDELKPYVEEQGLLSFFEVLTIMAFKFFALQGVDFAVLETGIGGRLDATNVVDSVVCGITNISYDHTHLLGNTLEQIAQEKAGIIKENGLVVMAQQEPAVEKVISSRCAEKKAKLYQVGKEIVYDPIGSDLDGSLFDLRGKLGLYEALYIPLIGQHQLSNAAIAIGIIKLLKLYDIVISLLAIKNGLKIVHWPGRMQVLHKHPFLILDGAQNSASAKALRTAIGMLLIPKKSVLILGVSKDKDVEGICKNICSGYDLIIVTGFESIRAMDVSVLETVVKRYNQKVEQALNVKQALDKALKNIGIDDLITVTGSFYLIGEVLKMSRTIRFPAR
ncbi:MAG: bifunctional folylpolyglutamate synthase/dihydrofolate synthase [Candidatus Omnitrophota bacterium]|nr:MAG: bifunctional folylpolyglutamate synthase/dihydrofolate synthase [Candidatus Omnitrophota bacterium]